MNVVEDFKCDDYICASLDIIGPVDLILRNISTTKNLMLITDYVAVGCCSILYYYKKYANFWGYMVAAV